MIVLVIGGVITSAVIPWVGCLLAIRVACGVPRLYFDSILCLSFLLLRFVLALFFLSFSLLVRYLSVFCLYRYVPYVLFSVFRFHSCSCIVLNCLESFSFSTSVYHHLPHAQATGGILLIPALDRSVISATRPLTLWTVRFSARGHTRIKETT